ncbi:hypothetical protein ACFCYH_37610, partial [Streptomyces sp. NPDC056400]
DAGLLAEGAERCPHRTVPFPGVRDVVVGSKWGYTYTAEWRTDAATHEVKEVSGSSEHHEDPWRPDRPVP